MKSLFQVISDIIPEPDLMPKIQPQVLEKGVNPFSDDLMRKIETYKDRAVSLQDFQGLVTLIDIAVNELVLHPIHDRDKVAMIFNKYRTDRGLSAL